MSEQFQHNDSLPPAPVEQDVAALLKKILQQLVFLEKKIDGLANQSSSRPVCRANGTGRPFREREFSKPSRPFGQYHRSGRDRDNASGEKSFSPRRHFEKRHGEENQSFGHRRKDYDSSLESDSGQRQQFKKRDDGRDGGFEQKNKPFYSGRKERR